MIDILGILGAGLLLYAFAMTLSKKWHVSETRYDAFNLVGSGMLVIYASATGTLPFVILNLVWAGFSFKGLMESRSSRNR